MRKAVFVDLANFYSGLVRSGIGEPRELRDYFIQWLDFDLLSIWLTQERVPVWIFYSGRRLGRKSERIEHKILTDYADRINRLPGVTAYDVEIPGEQREAMTVVCEKCESTNSVLWESEKGTNILESVTPLKPQRGRRNPPLFGVFSVPFVQFGPVGRLQRHSFEFFG